jgi:hypothetical protein
MPDVLWRVFRQNRALEDALPGLAANAVEALAMAKHGLRTGTIAFLHTFNGQLEFNSHVHTMVTAGGWQAASRSWMPTVFCHRDTLMRLWRRGVLSLLREALQAGVLTTDLTIEEMKDMLVKQERWWSVKIQSIDSIQHFFEYSGRYARRPVIAQRRIIDMKGDTVRFWAKDKYSGEAVQIRYSLEEFIDRLAQHILKHYQHAVRYFGLFAPRSAHQMLNAIFAAIGHKRRPLPAPLRWGESLRQMSGRDPLLDQNGQRMYWVRQRAPLVSH